MPFHSYLKQSSHGIKYLIFYFYFRGEETWGKEGMRKLAEGSPRHDVLMDIIGVEVAESRYAILSVVFFLIIMLYYGPYHTLSNSSPI